VYNHWLKFNWLSYLQRTEIQDKRLIDSLIPDTVKSPCPAKLAFYKSEKDALREIFYLMGYSADVYEASFKISSRFKRLAHHKFAKVLPQRVREFF
jgi:hypothetical protein